MALKNPKSYLLVFMQDDGPGRYQPGMVVDVRDISRPLGRLETLPKFGVVYTDLPVADLQDLIEEDVIDLVIAVEPEQIFHGKRKLSLNLTNPSTLKRLAKDGIDELTGAEIAAIKKPARSNPKSGLA